MITILLLFLLLMGFLMGLKRGLILQLFHLFGYIISYIVAMIYFKKLSGYLSLWIPYPELSGDSWAAFLSSLPLENAFYNAIAFMIVFFATKVILQIIASMLDFVARLPLLKLVNKGLGAFLGFIEVYLTLFLLLSVMALLPVEKIQNLLESSRLAVGIVKHTPFLSKAIESLWFTEVLSKMI